MYIVRDLSGSTAPVVIEVYYNGTIGADSVTKRYKGSLVKVQDVADVDNGSFYTWAGGATAMKNVCGILAEDQEITTNYLPTNGTYGMKTRKMYPLLPSSVVRAEYSQYDASGTLNYDTGATCSAASDAFTLTTVADLMIGGWIYFLTGLNAGYLHYIEDGNSNTGVVLSTALNYACVTGDFFLVIQPAACSDLKFDAHYSNILSELGTNDNPVVGIMHHVAARNLEMQKLNMDLHDGLKLDGAKFYHDFTIPHYNVWTTGIV